jgi:hypothetical protein
MTSKAPQLTLFESHLATDIEETLMRIMMLAPAGVLAACVPALQAVVTLHS